MRKQPALQRALAHPHHVAGEILVAIVAQPRRHLGVHLRALAGQDQQLLDAPPGGRVEDLQHLGRGVEVRLVRGKRAVLAVAAARPRERQRQIAGERDPAAHLPECRREAPLSLGPVRPIAFVGFQRVRGCFAARGCRVHRCVHPDLHRRRRGSRRQRRPRPDADRRGNRQRPGDRRDGLGDGPHLGRALQPRDHVRLPDHAAHQAQARRRLLDRAVRRGGRRRAARARPDPAGARPKPCTSACRRSATAWTPARPSSSRRS